MRRKLIFVIALVVSVISITAYFGWKQQSSINPQIQSILQDKIDKALVEYQAKNVMAILMDAKNGQIVAMHSVPNKRSVFDNKYEFGSILSLFNPVLAMENGIDINRRYDISKPFVPTDKNGKTITAIRDTIAFAKSDMNISEIAINTANVGHAQIALDLPETAYNELFSRLNMNSTMDLDFGRTSTPILPTEWNEIDRIKASLGQGVYVSPIHLMATVNATINDGLYVFPSMKRPQSVNRVIASEHSTTLRDIMHKIALNVWNTDMNVGIKSASAVQTGGAYVVTAVFATFPIENPRYSLLVIVDDAQQKYKTAVWNALPLTKSILTEIIPIL